MLSAADAQAIADAYGLGAAVELSEPVARGVQGQVRRLRCGAGTWAVKEWFDGFAPEPGELEAGCRLQTAAVAAGLPAPSPRRTGSGAVVAPVAGVDVRVESWVELGAPTRDADPALVGRLLAGLHRLAVDGSDVPDPSTVDPWYVEPVGLAGWRRLTDESHAARAPFAKELDDLVPVLLEAEDFFAPPDAVRLCHRDLWPDNVLPSPTTGLVVIDWENAGPADPAHELAMVVLGFAGHDPDRAQPLLSAYAEAGGPARLHRRSDFTMAGACLGHILQMHVEDWIRARAGDDEDPDTIARRSRANAGVREILAEPLTTRLVDRLLAQA